jgi:hypothetical protein
MRARGRLRVDQAISYPRDQFAPPGRCQLSLENVFSARNSAGLFKCSPAFRSVLPKRPCSLTALSAGC